MGTRTRTKTRGLVSHTTPYSSYLSIEERLKKKFDRGTISTEELRRLVTFTVVSRNTRIYKEVKIFGEWQPLHKLHIDISILISENFELR